VKAKRVWTVRRLAEALDRPFEGDGEVALTGAAGLESAGPGDLVFLENARLRPALGASPAAAVVAKPGELVGSDRPVIRASDPHRTFARAVGLMFPAEVPVSGVHPSACIAPTAAIGEGASVGALCVVADGVEIGPRTVLHPLVCLAARAKVGADCVLHPQVTIGTDCVLGDRVTLHAGVVVGADGFGYLREADGGYFKIPQVGRVRIEDDVEIGANSCIDRAALDETVIRRGAKIDDLVMIAHNVDVGENTIVVAQTGIAGSSKVGRDVILGGQVGIPDHLTIGDGSIVAAKSGVTKSLPPKSFVSGSPHLDARTWRKVWAVLPDLPALVKELRRLLAREPGRGREGDDPSGRSGS